MITGKNSLQKIGLMNLYQYIVLIVFCATLCLPSKIHSQCNPPFDIPFELVELDSIINYTFISSNT